MRRTYARRALSLVLRDDPDDDVITPPGASESSNLQSANGSGSGTKIDAHLGQWEEVAHSRPRIAQSRGGGDRDADSPGDAKRNAGRVRAVALPSAAELIDAAAGVSSLSATGMESAVASFEDVDQRFALADSALFSSLNANSPATSGPRAKRRSHSGKGSRHQTVEEQFFLPFTDASRAAVSSRPAKKAKRGPSEQSQSLHGSPSAMNDNERGTRHCAPVVADPFDFDGAFSARSVAPRSHPAPVVTVSQRRSGTQSVRVFHTYSEDVDTFSSLHRTADSDGSSSDSGDCEVAPQSSFRSRADHLGSPSHAAGASLFDMQRGESGDLEGRRGNKLHRSLERATQRELLKQEVGEKSKSGKAGTVRTQVELMNQEIDSASTTLALEIVLLELCELCRDYSREFGLALRLHSSRGESAHRFWNRISDAVDRVGRTAIIDLLVAVSLSLYLADHVNAATSADANMSKAITTADKRSPSIIVGLLVSTFSPRPSAKVSNSKLASSAASESTTNSSAVAPFRLGFLHRETSSVFDESCADREERVISKVATLFDSANGSGPWLADDADDEHWRSSIDCFISLAACHGLTRILCETNDEMQKRARHTLQGRALKIISSHAKVATNLLAARTSSETPFWRDSISRQMVPVSSSALIHWSLDMLRIQEICVKSLSSDVPTGDVLKICYGVLSFAAHPSDCRTQDCTFCEMSVLPTTVALLRFLCSMTHTNQMLSDGWFASVKADVLQRLVLSYLRRLNVCLDSDAAAVADGESFAHLFDVCVFAMCLCINLAEHVPHNRHVFAGLVPEGCPGFIADLVHFMFVLDAPLAESPSALELELELVAGNKGAGRDSSLGRMKAVLSSYIAVFLAMVCCSSKVRCVVMPIIFADSHCTLACIHRPQKRVCACALSERVRDFMMFQAR